ncbi:MAG: type II toxin-antitoxin system VapC family toxin [Steroidobacteraceae bacterium]
MIAVDTNLLVYAHRADAAEHAAASGVLRGLAEGRARWALPWPCIHEFIAVVTHPRIFSPPTPLPAALDQVDAWLESPVVMTLTESTGYWDRLRDQLKTGKVAGARVHDARIATLCLHHGVRELWSADRDFSRFPQLAVRNPLSGA